MTREAFRKKNKIKSLGIHHPSNASFQAAQPELEGKVICLLKFNVGDTHKKQQMGMPQRLGW